MSQVHKWLLGINRYMKAWNELSSSLHFSTLSSLHICIYIWIHVCVYTSIDGWWGKKYVLEHLKVYYSILLKQPHTSSCLKSCQAKENYWKQTNEIRKYGLKCINDKTQAGLTLRSLCWLQTFLNPYYYKFKTDEKQN